MGITGVATGSKEKEGATAAMSIDNNGKRLIIIATKNNSISELSFGSNKYNLANVLVHEYHHFENHVIKIGGNLDDEKYKSLGTTPEVEGGSQRHIESYWAQVCHNSWKKTDFSWKEYQLKVVAKYLTYLSQTDGELAMSWKQKFEKRCKFKFGEMTNSPSENTIVWE